MHAGSRSWKSNCFRSLATTRPILSGDCTQVGGKGKLGQNPRPRTAPPASGMLGDKYHGRSSPFVRRAPANARLSTKILHTITAAQKVRTACNLSADEHEGIASANNIWAPLSSPGATLAGMGTTPTHLK